MEGTKVLHKKTSAEATRSKVLAPKLRFKGFGGELLPTKFGKVVESNLYGQDLMLMITANPGT